MANQGATLQNYNTELIKMLETIKENREEVQTEIDAEESEKKQIEETMRQLSARLQEINESLSKKYNTRNEFDKTIAETENAFMKILESSQTLLHVLKKEGASLNKKKAQTLAGVKKEYETPSRDHQMESGQEEQVNVMVQQTNEENSVKPSPRFGFQKQSMTHLRKLSQGLEINTNDQEITREQMQRSPDADFSFSNCHDELDRAGFYSQSQSFQVYYSPTGTYGTIFGSAYSPSSQHSPKITMEELEMQFKKSQQLVEQKWLDHTNWPESSPLRIELFSLEMQAIYGSFYRNKIKVSELVDKVVKDESNKLAYVEAWKHKFRKSQKEAMVAYINVVSKAEQFLLQLTTKSMRRERKNSEGYQSGHKRQTSRSKSPIISQTSKKERKQSFSNFESQTIVRVPVEDQPIQIKTIKITTRYPPRSISQSYMSNPSPKKDDQASSLRKSIPTPTEIVASPKSMMKQYNRVSLNKRNANMFQNQTVSSSRQLYLDEIIEEQQPPKPSDLGVQIEQQPIKIERDSIIEIPPEPIELPVVLNFSLEQSLEAIVSVQTPEVNFITNVPTMKMNQAQLRTPNPGDRRPDSMMKSRKAFRGQSPDDPKTDNKENRYTESIHQHSSKNSKFSDFSFRNYIKITSEITEEMVLSAEEELKVTKHFQDQQKLDISHLSSIDNMSKNSYIVGPDEPYIEVDKLPSELRNLGEALNSQDEFVMNLFYGSDPETNQRFHLKGVTVRYPRHVKSYWLRPDLQQIETLSQLLGIDQTKIKYQYSLAKLMGRMNVTNADDLFKELQQSPLSSFNQENGKIQYIKEENYHVGLKKIPTLSGLLVGRHSYFVYSCQQIQEDTIMVMLKSVEQDNYKELKQLKRPLISKRAEIGLSLLRLQILKRNDSKDDIIAFNVFNCIDYNLLFDSASKTNQEAVAEQDLTLIINGFKKYQ